MGGAYGDFNNDGFIDLAYIAGSNPGVASPLANVMLGESDGQFHLGSQIKDEPAFSTVATGDFNGDGKLDLLVFGKSMHVYLGNGDGTFTHFKDYSFSGGSVVVADFNGDGKLDVAGVYNSGNGFEVKVLYGKGDGSFWPKPQTVAIASGTAPCGPAQNFLQVSDFNGDGIPDLAFCSLTQIGVVIGKGKGAFQQPTFINVGNNPQFTFAVGDINADGKVDLMVSQLGTGNIPVFSVFLGNGDGTFQSPETITFQPDFNAELGIIVGDFGSKGTLGVAIPTSNSQTYIYTQ